MGYKKRKLTVEHIVDICEGALGYDVALRIGALADLLGSQGSDDDGRQALIQRLGELTKRLKYGLPQTSAITLYECGFADRVVAQHLSSVIGSEPIKRSLAISALFREQDAVEEVLEGYPKYFRTCLAGLLA